MTAISSLGIGSNLDLTTLLANLKSGEQTALVPLQTQQTSFTSKLTAYGQLSSALSGLQAAATALSSSALYQGVKASSSASDVLSATAASSATGGSYAINVTQLSQAQSLATVGVASTTAKIGTGVPTTVTIDFGTVSSTRLDAESSKYVATLDADSGKYTGATFTADSTRAAASITINSTNNTLEGIRDAINKSTMDVTASIVNDGGTLPNRLVLTSKTSGETSSMRISVTGQQYVPEVAEVPAVPEVQAEDGSIVQAYVPAVPAVPAVAADPLVALLTNNPTGEATHQQLQQTVVAQNAKLTVNGLNVTSASNSVASAIQGVTMTVVKIGSSTLTAAQDTSSVQSAITTFVSAYNSLQTVSKQLSAFDTTKKTGAALLGDSVLRNIQVGIRSALTSPQVDDGSGLTMLSQIGLSFQKDGTLAIDSTSSTSSKSWTNPVKLSSVLDSNLSGVARLFAGKSGVGGYGTQLAALITTYTDATTGTLTSATKGINSSLDKLSTQYTATTERIDATVARYKAQFTQLDQMISRMNQTSSYLTQQFDAINNSTSK